LDDYDVRPRRGHVQARRLDSANGPEHVVVVNHHLLASDLAVRMASDNWQEAAVLPRTGG